MSFGAESTAADVIAGHDLTGRNVIVTGGAAGLGLETVRALATAGADIVVATRNVPAAEEVVESLRKETGNPGIVVSPLDVASLASVRQFTEAYLATERPLHLLINNAGVMAPPLSYTPDGFELQLGTNHLGHFALTNGLLPALRAAGGSRVVVLSSAGHRLGDLDFDDLHYRNGRPYQKFEAYGQSKTANALFAVELSRRFAEEGILSNALNPGGILTNLQRHMPREEQIGFGMIDQDGNPSPMFRNAAQGAATPVWAAVAPELDGVGGQYLENCAIAKPWSGIETDFEGYRPSALDPERAERLWAVSEELVKQ